MKLRARLSNNVKQPKGERNFSLRRFSSPLFLFDCFFVYFGNAGHCTLMFFLLPVHFQSVAYSYIYIGICICITQSALCAPLYSHLCDYFPNADVSSERRTRFRSIAIATLGHLPLFCVLFSHPLCASIKFCERVYKFIEFRAFWCVFGRTIWRTFFSLFAFSFGSVYVYHNLHISRV